MKFQAEISNAYLQIDSTEGVHLQIDIFANILGFNCSLVTNPQHEKAQICNCCQSRIETKLLVIWSPDPAASFPFVLRKTKHGTEHFSSLWSWFNLAESTESLESTHKIQTKAMGQDESFQKGIMGSKGVISKDSFSYLVTL